MPIAMPKKIVRPMVKRDCAPAPVARIGGTMPTTIAAVVIRIGRRRIDAASTIASRREAIEEAAAIRLRPILMTTAAMVVGMAPLILASGAGARSRFTIGITIFAGMAIGTLFTLFVTPMVYTFLARDHAAVIARERAAGHLAPEVEEV